MISDASSVVWVALRCLVWSAAAWRRFCFRWVENGIQRLQSGVKPPHSKMYRPNFCAECGEKLFRLRWHVWTSRRFCNRCAKRLRKTRVLPALATSLSLIAGGYVVGRVRRPATPPLVV